jgi:hypothetical protein
MTDPKYVKLGDEYFAPEWFDFDRGGKMKKYVRVRFKAPKTYIIFDDDENAHEETFYEERSISFSGDYDLMKAKSVFEAAYSEAEIIDISVVYLTDE